MAQLDKFIAAMTARKATALELLAGEQPSVEVAGGRIAVLDKCPTPAQVRRLVGEISPARVQSELSGSDSVQFEYTPVGGASVLVEITDWSGNPQVRIRPISGGDVTAALASSAIPRPTLAGSVPKDLVVAVPPPWAASTNEDIEGRAPAAEIDVGEAPFLPLAIPPPRVAVEGGPSANQRPAIDRLFRKMVAMGASDLHLSSAESPMTRVDGDMVRLDGEAALDAEALLRLLMPIVPEPNRRQFESDDDTDFAYEVPDLARFRANLFRDRKGVGAVFRQIPAKIISAEKLGLAQVIRDFCNLHKGLVLVTGPTGSGKSTTLCAMVDLINRTRSGHIITIEDPIEFVHENQRCLVNQREIGPHTRSFKRALRAALREDPDVVLVGEMRDLETISIAIETAETGHLVFGTLHTTTAYSTIDRIIDQYPADQQEQIRVMLSESLKGVVSQTLCKKIGGGRVAALEILVVTPAVSNLIREGKTFQIPSIMQTSRNLGMRLLNEALLDLVQSGKVTATEAISKAIDKAGLLQALKQKELVPGTSS